MRLTASIVVLLATSAMPAFAEPMTPSVRAMVERAVRSGDMAKADSVVGVAKEMHPESAADIDAIVASYNAEQETARQERLAEAGFFDNWKGTGEIGGSMATGNSDTITAAAGLTLGKEGLRWRHAISAMADFQRSNGTNDQERYAVGYQIDRKLTERLYMLGAVGWERNQVAGLKSRFTESLGLGYTLINQPNLTWSIEGGPALRQAKFVDRDENSLAFRAGTSLGWDISPTTRFTQTATGYFESGSSSLLSSTALTAQLVGALSARLSFNVQYESDPPAGDKHTDTITRATLVYAF